MKIKILLVEDDTSLGFIISDHLTSEGYDVTLCSDGKEGFQRFNEESFHMCIFDVMMPKKDGFSLSKDIRKSNTHVPMRRVNIKTEENKSLHQIGGYLFDTLNFQLTHPDFDKTLTKKEAQILTFLCKCTNQVVSREMILTGVWGQDDYFVGRSLDVFITKLRKYLKHDDHIQIINVHGVGFKLEVKS